MRFSNVWKITLTWGDATGYNSSSKRFERQQKKTGVRRIPAYSAPRPALLLRAANDIGAALGALQPHDRASLLLPDGEQIPFNPNSRVPQETVDDLVVERTLSNEDELILKVKKPDFLGDSQWEFVHDSAFEAKVVDYEWLAKFRNGEVLLEPGSAIRALVSVDVAYGYDREVISRKYQVIKVYEVIPPAGHEQRRLLP